MSCNRISPRQYRLALERLFKTFTLKEIVARTGLAEQFLRKALKQ